MRRSMQIGTLAALLVLLMAAESAQAQLLFRGERFRRYDTTYYPTGFRSDTLDDTGWYVGPPAMTPNDEAPYRYGRFSNFRRPVRSYSNQGGYYYRDSGDVGLRPSNRMDSGSIASTDESRSGVRQSFYARPELDDKTAGLRIIVPMSNARVWIENSATKQDGIERVFVSPPLERGKDYTYSIRVTWMENGREMSTEKTVPVKPGHEAVAYFGTRPVEDLSRPRRLLR